MNLPGARRTLLILGVIFLMTVLAVELGLTAREQSQTFDEACHIMAGYLSWKNFDFGINPEHPPLVKLVAAVPLLRMRLRVPQLPIAPFEAVEFLSGREFLYTNDAGSLLFRARLASTAFTLCLGLAVFLATMSMWGRGAAFLALILFVFEPNILAHGALVTTDMGVTCGLFLAVWAFYLYIKRPSLWRLFGSGVAAGLALATKHSGILAFPILFLLALTEVLPALCAPSKTRAANVRKQGLRMAVSLVGIGAIALVMLWASYGFRYQSRPRGMELNPPLSAMAARLGPLKSRVIVQTAAWRLLPESYLAGLAEVFTDTDMVPMFLLGKVYPHGKWFYFPTVFWIKSTLGFLLLCLLSPLARALRHSDYRREMLFFVIPPVIYFAFAMSSTINLGVRHILPVYPFLVVFAAVGAWSLAKQRSRWAAVVAVLLIFHIVSSIRTFPNYLAYSNETWGGPANTYEILADSNVDWGQGLKAMKRYLDRDQIKDCWFAYYGSVVADTDYYGIPCKALPSSFGKTVGAQFDMIPQVIQGTVFVSASEASGALWGPEEMNPYFQFLKARPVASIADSILVFRGRFDVSLVFALAHASMAARLAQSGRLNQALVEAETGVAAAPNSVDTQVALGNVLAQMMRRAEARRAYQTALALARTAHPDFQRFWIAPLEAALGRLGGDYIFRCSYFISDNACTKAMRGSRALPPGYLGGRPRKAGV